MQSRRKEEEDAYGAVVPSSSLESSTPIPSLGHLRELILLVPAARAVPSTESVEVGLLVGGSELVVDVDGDLVRDL